MDTAEEIEAIIKQNLTALIQKDIPLDEPIWKYFPPNRGFAEARATTLFFKFVSEKFEVILSERDWENPSIRSLTSKILIERKDPRKMFAAYEERIRGMRRGLCYAVILFSLVSIIPLFMVPPGRRNSAIVISFALASLSAFLLWMLWRRENKRLVGARRLYLKHKELQFIESKQKAP